MEISFFTPTDNTATITPTPAPVTGTSAMILALELITPDIARQILDSNTENRLLRERHVRFLADQVRAGVWQVTGDPVKIATSGRLLDGQHRLAAVVESGTSQQVYVARNCEEAIFSVLDTGRSRTSSDVLATAGLKNYTAMAAAAKILLLYEAGQLGILNKSGRRETTNSAVLEYATRHDLDESTTKAHTWAKRSKLLSVGEMTALHYLLSQKDAILASFFLEQVVTGLNLTEGHPVFCLRNKLQAARDGRFNYNTAERMALTIKAWNAVREGRKVSQLVWRGENFPKIV